MGEQSNAKTPYEKPTFKKLTPEQAVNVRKPYDKPTVTRLTGEQAKLKLLGLLSEGEQQAKHLLELMFPDAPPKAKKNSA